MVMFAVLKPFPKIFLCAEKVNEKTPCNKSQRKTKAKDKK